MTLIMVKCYNVVGRTVVSEQGMQAWQESAYYLPKVFKSWQVNSDTSGRGQFLSKHYDWVSFYVGWTYILSVLSNNEIFYITIQFP